MSRDLLVDNGHRLIRRGISGRRKTQTQDEYRRDQESFHVQSVKMVKVALKTTSPPNPRMEHAMGVEKYSAVVKTFSDRTAGEEDNGADSDPARDIFMPLGKDKIRTHGRIFFHLTLHMPNA
jgi:hypothetical protein